MCNPVSEIKLPMDKILRFWVDCEVDQMGPENVGRTKLQLIADVLREFEHAGDAMRYLDANGLVAWKATPALLSRLADAEREVEADWDD
jgi:hypothetical protein